MTSYNDLHTDDAAVDPLNDPLAKVRELLEGFNEKHDALARLAALDEATPAEGAEGAVLIGALKSLSGEIKDEISTLREAGHEVALGRSLRNGHWFLRGPAQGTMRGGVLS